MCQYFKPVVSILRLKQSWEQEVPLKCWYLCTRLQGVCHLHHHTLKTRCFQKLVTQTIELSALRVRTACTKHFNNNINYWEETKYLSLLHWILSLSLSISQYTCHLTLKQRIALKFKLYYMSNYCERFEMHPKTLLSHYSNMTIANESTSVQFSQHRKILEMLQNTVLPCGCQCIWAVGTYM